MIELVRTFNTLPPAFPIIAVIVVSVSSSVLLSNFTENNKCLIGTTVPNSSSCTT